jgi:hypothetical protein
MYIVSDNDYYCIGFFSGQVKLHKNLQMKILKFLLYMLLFQYVSQCT